VGSVQVHDGNAGDAPTAPDHDGVAQGEMPAIEPTTPADAYGQDHMEFQQPMEEEPVALNQEDDNGVDGWYDPLDLQVDALMEDPPPPQGTGPDRQSEPPQDEPRDMELDPPAEGAAINYLDYYTLVYPRGLLPDPAIVEQKKIGLSLRDTALFLTVYWFGCFWMKDCRTDAKEVFFSCSRPPAVLQANRLRATKVSPILTECKNKQSSPPFFHFKVLVRFATRSRGQSVGQGLNPSLIFSRLPAHSPFFQGIHAYIFVYWIYQIAKLSKGRINSLFSMMRAADSYKQDQANAGNGSTTFRWKDWFPYSSAYILEKKLAAIPESVSDEGFEQVHVVIPGKSCES
jgi:hypothetical protein